LMVDDLAFFVRATLGDPGTGSNLQLRRSGMFIVTRPTRPASSVRSGMSHREFITPDHVAPNGA
jgi:hypothetical protein